MVNSYHCRMIIRYCVFFLLILYNCSNIHCEPVITGAEQTGTYLPLIKGKKVALVVNQTSKIGQTHLVDTLLSMKIIVTGIFAPEHGFRGEASAGTAVNGGRDAKTGIKITSLYGNRKKPYPEDLNGIETVIFDIQDVGVRYYTYISTMHYVMEACAELNIPVIILDRPNPNGHYIDGPVLDSSLKSFVGMHPIPLVHGCTVGELAQMINGEGWLKNKIKCALTVITCKNYMHKTEYILPVRPSPNLQSQSAVYLYPSLGLFEGTMISIGQGTDKPYQCFGSPAFDWGNIKFVPASIKGVSEKPKYLGYACTGFDLTWYGYNRAVTEPGINLNWLILSYRISKNKKDFFTDFFEKLSGTRELRKQIQAGKSAYEIRLSWTQDIEIYKVMRMKYRIYPD